MKYGAPKGRNDDTVTAAALAAWGLEKICGGGSVLIGGTEDELLPGKKKTPIDPSCQIDCDAMISKMESRQIAGFGYGSIDDFNIISDYKEEE